MTAVVEVCADGVVRESPSVLVAHRAKLPLGLNAAKKSKGIWLIQKELADWKEWAKDEAEGMAAMTPPVVVTVEHLRKNAASMPDTGAPILAVKAVIDGLVEAGILPDDGPEFVVELLFLAPIIVGWQGLRVTLAEVPL